MLTIRHLEMVRALARCGHFGRAAEELCISQPALSKGIASIERLLGVPAKRSSTSAKVVS